jgi:HlyD family secretion protein
MIRSKLLRLLVLGAGRARPGFLDPALRSARVSRPRRWPDRRSPGLRKGRPSVHVVERSGDRSTAPCALGAGLATPPLARPQVSWATKRETFGPCCGAVGRPLHNAIWRPFHSALAIALLLLFFSGCQSQSVSAPGESKAGESAIHVEVIQPERKTICRTIEQPAEIKPYEETPLYGRVAGYLRSVHVDIGDPIRGPRPDAKKTEDRPGQVLGELFIPEVEDQVRQKAAQVTQAEANVEQARAAIRLAEATVLTSRAMVAQTDAVIKHCQAEYQKRESELQRFTVLAANGSVSEKLVDEAREHFQAADADRQETQAKKQSAEATVAESQAALEKAKADLMAAEAHTRVAAAEHAEATTMLSYGTLRAPYDGIVTRRNVHTGYLVQPGTQGEPLLVLMRTDILRVLIDIPEGDAALIKLSNQVSIRIPAKAGEAISGQITRTAGALDPTTRTLRIEADVRNGDDRLRPGMYAYAHIVVAEHSNALILPASAVLSDKTRSYCCCVANGKVVQKDVSLGLRDKDEVEISAGLEGNEAVIRVNSTAFAEGQEVQAKTYSPAKS